ncbi:MAG: gliding motility-associated C-terminal domain-containing protein [Bacteroidota bacterium]
MRILKNYCLSLFFFCFLLPSYLQAQGCGCTACPLTIPITDFTGSLEYIVQGLDNDDLSGSQCVESVNIVFRHNRIQNLTVELVSPAGQVVPLIGPYVEFGGSLNGTFGSTWDVNFVQCFPDGQAAPDPGLMEVWSNFDLGWNGFGSAFAGTYYPTEDNCLQDFDTGSANGTWQLRIQNFSFPPPADAGIIESFSITFCDETGLDCCGADAGEIFNNFPPIEDCVNSRFLDFGLVEPIYEDVAPDNTVYGYTLLVIQNGIVIALLDELDMNNFPVGVYFVYGYSYALSDENAVENLVGTRLTDIQNDNVGICGDLSEDRFRIQLSPAAEEIIIPTTICEGDSIEIDGVFESEPGVYTEVLDNPSLICDTTLIYELSVITPSRDTFTESICEGQSFFFDGADRTTTGFYTSVIASTQGCDSVVTVLNLTVNEVFQTAISDTICEGESFQLGTQNLTTAGQFTENFQTVNGCDSIVTLNLTVSEILRDTIAAQICQGQSFEFGTQTLNASGQFEENFQASNGCDSIVTLNLTVEDVLRDTIAAQICRGQSFQLGTQSLNTSGEFEENFQSSNGCDSIVTLNLVVEDAIRADLNEAICPGETFQFGTNILDAAGTYSDTLVAASGCDSIITLNLAIRDAIREDLNESICPNTTFQFGTRTLDQSGIYRDTLTTAEGCDSIITLNLSIEDAIQEDLNASICPGTTFQFGTRTLDQAGIYTDTLNSVNGCDSIVTLNLSIDDIIQENIEGSICPGTTFDFGTRTLDQAGTYVDTLSAANGCDSIVTLNLSIEDIIREDIDEAICSGRTFQFGTRTLDQAGIYTDTLSTPNGCDSIVTLNLSIEDIIRENIDAAICTGATFQFGTRTLDQAGIYTDTLSTAEGCDSIVILSLSIEDIIRENIDESICSGTTFQFGTQTLDQAGIYVDTLSTAGGCDSVVTLNLTVENISRDTIEAQICEGSIFSFGNQTLSVAGIYSDTLNATNGCDSIITLNLSVEELLRDTIMAQICPGSTFQFGNQTLNAAGIYSDTLSATNGCDSIVLLDLAVTDLIETTFDVEICDQETYEFGDQILNTSGTFRQTFTTPSGCDSTVTLNLSILKSSQADIARTICEGESFQFGNQMLNVAGVYVDTLTAINGCDSTITLTLNVNDAARTNLNESICPGTTFQFGTQILDAAGVYSDTLVAVNGCDSIVTLNLSIDEVEVNILSDSDAIGCEFTDLTLSVESNRTINSIQWISSGDTISSAEELEIASGGTYQVIIQTLEGCTAENSITISEDIAGVNNANLDIQQPNCEGSDLGNITIGQVVGGTPPYVYALNEGAFTTGSNFSGLEVGDYIVRIQDAQGCEWDSTITILPAFDLTVDLGEDRIISFGESVTLDAILNGTISSIATWTSSGKDSLACLDDLCLSQLVQPLNTTIYSIRIEDDKGCVATDEITVFVELKEDIYSPNAFSPNGDNRNDFFYLQTSNEAVEEIEYLQIFDRWGHLIFQQNAFAPNDESLGWDGRAQSGDFMNPAVFVFVAKINYVDGSSKLLEGEVVLIR